MSIVIGAASGFQAVTKTSAYGPAVNGDLVLCDASTAAFTVTLPATGPSNMQIAVKKIDTSANAVTVVGSGTATIDGDPSCLLLSTGAAAVFAFDGTNWRVLSTAIINSGTDSLQQLLVPTYTAGLWYDRRSAMPAPANTASVAGSTYCVPSTIVYVPLFAHRALTIDTIGYCTGSTGATSGATVRHGLYANTAANLPGTQLYDFGAALTLGTAPNVMLTRAAAGIIPKGWSWMALSFNATSPGSCWGVASNQAYAPATGTTTANLTYLAQVNWGWPQAYTEAGTGGLNAVAAPTSGAAGSNSLVTPNVWFRVVS